MPRLHMSAEKTSRCHTRQRARAALLQAAMQCLRATELHDEVKVAVLMVRLPKLHNKLVGPALRTEQLHDADLTAHASHLLQLRQRRLACNLKTAPRAPLPRNLLSRKPASHFACVAGSERSTGGIAGPI